METDVITNMPGSSSSGSSNNISGNENSHMWKYLIIFLVLALLGFNLFTYFGQLSKILGRFTDKIIDLFRPILAYFGYGVGQVAKKTINVTADTLTGGIDVLEKGLKKPARREKRNDKQQQQQQQQQPLPDESGSLTQGNKGTRKAGFCYIGEDRGFRSCISVGEGNDCMSGNIFPTRDLCVNPNLR